MRRTITTLSLFRDTKLLIDSMYLKYIKIQPTTKARFLHYLFELMQNADWELFSFFNKYIKQRYQQDYDIVIAPILIADIENKTFYNIYADLKDFNFKVLYSVGDLHKSLIFLSQDLAVKYIR